MTVLPEIDDPTQQAIESSVPARDTIVRAYLRLIGYELQRVAQTIAADIDHTTDRPLPHILEGLTAGRDELAATLGQPKPWLSVPQLQINIRRFNNEELQNRLISAFTTQRPQPGQQEMAESTQLMTGLLDRVIERLERAIAGQIASDAVVASLAANFPPGATKQASVTMGKIVANLRALYRAKRLVADWGLPSNMPAHQTRDAGGNVIIAIHPAGFLALDPSTAASTLLHEGSHAFDPVNIVDYVYRDSGLHVYLPAELALCNAANYEQVVADITGKEGGPKPGGGSPAVRTAVAYLTVRITRAWVMASNVRATVDQKVKAAQPPGLREYNLGRWVAAPFGRDVPAAVNIRGDQDILSALRAPLPIDAKLMADVFNATSVLLDTITTLRIGPTQRGPLAITRSGPAQPCVLRLPEDLGPVSGDELQARILEQLALAAQQTGRTSHVTAGELETIVLNVPDLLSPADLAKLKLLQDAERAAPERKAQ